MTPLKAGGGRSVWLALGAYLLLLHAVLFVLVVKTNFLLLTGKTLGFVPPEEWNPELIARVLEQAREDRIIEDTIAQYTATPSARIILLGDSIIAQLDTLIPETINFGVGGDTTHTLLARLPMLRSVSRGRAVVIGVGVNDLKYRPIEQIARDYQSVLAGLPPMLPVVAVSVLPVDENGPAARQRPYLRNERLRALNAALQRACAARPGCGFLDVWPALARAGVYGDDGWHLSPEGNQILARALRDALPMRE